MTDDFLMPSSTKPLMHYIKTGLGSIHIYHVYCEILQILFNFTNRNINQLQDIYSSITIFDQCDYKQNCLLIMHG